MAETLSDVQTLNGRPHLKTGYYCPYCGKQDMWQELGPGDYYVGPTTICLACEQETDRLDVWPKATEPGH